MERCNERCGHQEKTNWPGGAWRQEPDRLEFEHAGFACLLHRGPIGQWCGYCGVPPSHPMYGKHYDDVAVDVHGGLTYSDRCQKEGPICHTPKPGEPDDLYWFGFDCAHLGDLAPGMLRVGGRMIYSDTGDIYRDLSYVRDETERLAEQLAAMK